MNMNFDFNNPTKILFGSGKLNELGSQPLPGKKALLLMSGGKSAKVSGAYDRTLEQLRKAGVAVSYTHLPSSLQYSFLMASIRAITRSSSIQ